MGKLFFYNYLGMVQKAPFLMQKVVDKSFSEHGVYGAYGEKERFFSVTPKAFSVKSVKLHVQKNKNSINLYHKGIISSGFFCQNKPCQKDACNDMTTSILNNYHQTLAFTEV